MFERGHSGVTPRTLPGVTKFASGVADVEAIRRALKKVESSPCLPDTLNLAVISALFHIFSDVHPAHKLSLPLPYGRNLA